MVWICASKRRLIMERAPAKMDVESYQANSDDGKTGTARIQCRNPSTNGSGTEKAVGCAEKRNLKPTYVIRRAYDYCRENNLTAGTRPKATKRDVNANCRENGTDVASSYGCIRRRFRFNLLR